MNEQPLRTLTTFVQRLEQAHIHYTLTAPRADAIMVQVTVPGERWEIEFFSGGEIEVERFLSNGEICGAEVLPALLTRYGDCASADVA